MELYDFGDSMTVMPMPDFEKKDSFLSSLVIYVVDVGNHRAMGIEISNPPPTVEAEAIQKAFPKYSAEITAGGYLPKPVKLEQILNAEVS